jgi:hypothetical protein
MDPTKYFDCPERFPTYVFKVLVIPERLPLLEVLELEAPSTYVMAEVPFHVPAKWCQPAERTDVSLYL